MNREEFDAVQLMRQAREKINTEMRDMSFEEQRAYIERRAAEVRRMLLSRRETTAV